VQVNFLPSEDSGFDVCYDCFLAMTDEDGAKKIVAFEVENVFD